MFSHWDKEVPKQEESMKMLVMTLVWQPIKFLSLNSLGYKSNYVYVNARVKQTSDSSLMFEVLPINGRIIGYVTINYL